MAELMPMCSACFTASLLSCERPPAKRRKARRVDEAEEGDGGQYFLLAEWCLPFQRCAGDGAQEVDGDGLYFQLAQCEGEFDALLHALAHADDAAAADVHAYIAGGLQGAQLLFLRVRAAQLGKVGGAVSRLQ